MPAVAEYARPTSGFVFRIVDTESSLQPQGSEGRQLQRKANEAIQHWDNRAEVLIAEPDDAVAVSYVAVPPNRTFLVRTRYIYSGKGEPLPFELDDD